ncbi:MAG: AI-2E family transporter, partial [Deltaproteobacteria bacterium]|nr:AI-2E family transporter [Deltaproteobacteria bacterium]
VLILTFLMFVLAITPAGPVILYLPLSLILMFEDFYKGLGLLLWHLIFVSLADNVLRPILVAQSFKVSDWLLMFITLGGLYFLGFVGLFIAPILLAVSFHLLENSTNTSKDV